MRLIHFEPMKRAGRHTDSKACWCSPEPDACRVRRARKVFATGGHRGTPHLIVQYEDDGSALYMCDLCWAELVLEDA